MSEHYAPYVPTMSCHHVSLHLCHCRKQLQKNDGWIDDLATHLTKVSTHVKRKRRPISAKYLCANVPSTILHQSKMSHVSPQQHEFEPKACRRVVASLVRRHDRCMDDASATEYAASCSAIHRFTFIAEYGRTLKRDGIYSMQYHDLNQVEDSIKQLKGCYLAMWCIIMANQGFDEATRAAEDYHTVRQGSMLCLPSITRERGSRAVQRIERASRVLVQGVPVCVPHSYRVLASHGEIFRLRKDVLCH
nr:hypothetical protein CFP56_36231 [Quercus suber]